MVDLDGGVPKRGAFRPTVADSAVCTVDLSCGGEPVLSLLTDFLSPTIFIAGIS